MTFVCTHGKMFRKRQQTQEQFSHPVNCQADHRK